MLGTLEFVSCDRYVCDQSSHWYIMGVTKEATKSRSLQSKAGVDLSVSRSGRLMRRGHAADRVSSKAPVYVTGAVERMVEVLLHNARMEAKAKKANSARDKKAQVAAAAAQEVSESRAGAIAQGKKVSEARRAALAQQDAQAQAALPPGTWRT